MDGAGEFHAYLFPEPSPETSKLSNDLRNLFVEALLWLYSAGRWGARARASYAIGIKKVHVDGAGILARQCLVGPRTSDT